jgi:Phage portal protein, SPP1 Gp6-like
MSDQLKSVNGNADPLWAQTELAIREHISWGLPRYEKMWAYYRNPIELVRQAGLGGDGNGQGWYRSAQEVGLPTRIVGSGSRLGSGLGSGLVLGGERGRREVVIENDIGWRVATMVDFMFGSPVRIESLAEDEKTKQAIEDVLEAVWESSGGISLMQDMATLGHVFGHVDLLVRVDEEGLVGSRVIDAPEWISIEPIDARRGVAVMSSSDYRAVESFAVHVEREVVAEKDEKNAKPKRHGLGMRKGKTGPGGKKTKQSVTEVFTQEGWARFVDGERVDGDVWKLLVGRVPMVHVQNMSQPFVYSGIGEVEVLVGLQDELNTRLSDRASRVTMQSFKMYLAKGIEGFGGSSVGPGMVWSTDNPDASIEGFGGDASSPSEESHIGEIREAMDKISGVPPVAGGIVRAKLGNLSSANALRITLMSLIAKTQRKRVGYGRGIEQVSAMVLDVLDSAGVLKTDVRERGVRVVWGALPVVDEAAAVAAGLAKVDLGVKAEDVLDDLGFGDADPGVV